MNPLRNSPILGKIPLVDLRRDCPRARVQTIRHRGTIYTQGDSVQNVYCVLDGQVTLSKSNSEGMSLTTAVLTAGDFFGPAMNHRVEALDTARAKGTVSLWRAPEKEFWRLLIQHPPIALEFISLLTKRQHQLEERLEGFAFKRTEARLAATFRELSGGFATRCEHGLGQHLRLTQQELADLVGASRPVVSTLLNKLRKIGVLGYTREYICVRRIEDIDLLINS